MMREIFWKSLKTPRHRPTRDFKGFAADLRFFPPEHWCRHKSTWQAFVERHGREVPACASATQSFGSQGVNKRKEHQEAIRLRSPETVTWAWQPDWGEKKRCRDTKTTWTVKDTWAGYHILVHYPLNEISVNNMVMKASRWVFPCARTKSHRRQ